MTSSPQMILFNAFFRFFHVFNGESQYLKGYTLSKRVITDKVSANELGWHSMKFPTTNNGVTS